MVDTPRFSATPLTPVQQAQAAIADFEQSSATGVWPSLNKQTLVAEMRSRVQDPFQVNQGGQPFCGPACVVFELVRKQPLRYVQICRSLFETGGFQAQTRWIAASERLRQSQGKFRLSQVEWMVLSTLRESENLIFPVEPDAPDIIRNLGGMTKSWEMKGWVREILGYRNVKYTHAYLIRDIPAIQEAGAIAQQGGVALALINAGGMLTDKPPRVTYPSHWVALLGSPSIQKGPFWQLNSGQISFDVYSWARSMPVNLNLNAFKNHFWGVVTGLP